MTKTRSRKTSTGFPAIFSGKDRTRTRPAAMTKDGYAAFDAAKLRLAALVGRPAKTLSVSDADCIEFLARGDAASVEYLKATYQFKG